MSSENETQNMPYELLAEHMAGVEAEELLEQFGPDRIINSLSNILKASFYAGINTGLGIADFSDDDTTQGPAELMQAYINGYQDCKNDNKGAA